MVLSAVQEIDSNHSVLTTPGVSEEKNALQRQKPGIDPSILQFLRYDPVLSIKISIHSEKARHSPQR